MSWWGSPRAEQPLGWGIAVSRLGADLELCHCGRSLGPSQYRLVSTCRPAASSPWKKARVRLWTGLPCLDAKRFLEVFAQGLVPLSWGSAREPKHTGEGPKPHLHIQPRGCSVLGALLASVLLWPLHWNYDPGLLGERYGCRFLQPAKGYSNENYLKGGRALYGFSSCGLNESFKAAQRESGSLCQYVGYAASHTEVSPEEPRMFLTD